jgi:signal transduction histidine kinase
MKADRGEFERITTNLMRNASQAGARTVTVRASRPLPSGMAGAVIDVIDDGPGLPPELRQRLFEPFAVGRKGGTGLGLAIVRDLVQAHSGSVRLADVANTASGAHFRIELPRA